MTEEEIMIRAREAAIVAVYTGSCPDQFRRGLHDCCHGVQGAARALRDLSKPLSEIQPVDPDLIEARRIVAETWDRVHRGGRRLTWDRSSTVLEGKHDDSSDVQSALAAIKRGRELGREKGL